MMRSGESEGGEGPRIMHMHGQGSEDEEKDLVLLELEHERFGLHEVVDIQIFEKIFRFWQNQIKFWP